MTTPLNPPPHVYDGQMLDRAAERRRDVAWLAEQRQAPATRVVLVSDLRVPVSDDEAAPRLVAPTLAELDRELPEEAVLLALRDGAAWFAWEQPAAAIPLRQVELRSVGLLLPADEAALLAQARALMHWHARHRFCGACGHATEVRHAGHMRECPACGFEVFPRTDPAVIVLVTAGDQCLLARSARLPPGMYSTLAGFVEPGESLEGTLRREVLEEVGVSLATITYRSSQPWPFPQSLMLGFRATAATTELRLDQDEIEDALWVPREILRDPERRPVRLPGADSIARFLIEEWLAEA